MPTPGSSLPDPPNVPTILSTDDVVKMIAVAKNVGGNALSATVAILSALGNNATVSGDSLRGALSIADIPVNEALASLLAVIQQITKLGSQITWANQQQTGIVIVGVSLRFEKEIRCSVYDENGLPAIEGIAGVSVHEGMWIAIKCLAIRNIQGRMYLHVVTPLKSKDIPLG